MCDKMERAARGPTLRMRARRVMPLASRASDAARRKKAQSKSRNRARYRWQWRGCWRRGFWVTAQRSEHVTLAR